MPRSCALALADHLTGSLTEIRPDIQNKTGKQSRREGWKSTGVDMIYSRKDTR